MAKTQKQLQGEQTRQQIIDTAAHLFARKGFYGTSMSELTSATGLTKGAFYHHFETKDDLFFAVVQSVQEKWQNAVGREIMQVENALDQLTVLLNSHARLLRQEPTLCLVIMGLTAEMEDDNSGHIAALHGVYAALITVIEGIVQNGQARGQVREDVDARLTAVNVVGLLRGLSCFGVLNDMGLDCEIVIQEFEPVLLDGLRPR
jgi:AcrR family transcriptional regulator